MIQTDGTILTTYSLREKSAVAVSYTHLDVYKRQDFDRRDEVMKKIQENGTMYQKLQQMTQLLMQLAAMVTDFSGRPDLLEEDTRQL